VIDPNLVPELRRRIAEMERIVARIELEIEYHSYSDILHQKLDCLVTVLAEEIGSVLQHLQPRKTRRR
jgi:hypothetical protein